MHKDKSVSMPLEQRPTSKKEKAEMKNVPYSSTVGRLMHVMIFTRSDNAYTVGVVSQFLTNPGKEHWLAVKWRLRYLVGTSTIYLSLGKGKPVLEGYTNADMADGIDSRKSTSGYLIPFARGAISWQSKLQKCMALSTTEAEYIAAIDTFNKILWMKISYLNCGS